MSGNLESKKLPNKKYFRIGEVSTLVGVDTHVLRYWEKEFKIIKPFRGKSKQRLYRHQDVHNLLAIRKLLHQEGYTISGARKILAKRLTKTEEDRHDVTNSTMSDLKRLQFIKNELHAILSQLSRN